MPQPEVFILAQGRGLRTILSQLTGRRFTWVFLGQRMDQFFRVQVTLQQSGTYLDTGSRVQQAADDLRKPYLKYQFSIGKQLNSLSWWTSPLSYRSNYASKTFQQACDLKVALDLIAQWRGPDVLVMAFADAPVLQALKRNLSREDAARVAIRGDAGRFSWRPLTGAAAMLTHRASFVLSEAYRVFQAKRLVPQPHIPTEPTTLILSSVSARSMRLGPEFHRFFFGDLAAQLGKLGHRMGSVPVILPGQPYKRALRGLAGGSLPVMVPHRYLGFLDVLRAAISTTGRPPMSRPIPPLPSPDLSMDISPLIKNELRGHWVSNVTPRAMLLAALVRRWGETGASINRIIYLYENQPWERALCWETKRSLPRTVLVGYQHANVERHLLNFHLAAGEDGVAPLPDRVVTVGKTTAALLSANGYQPGKVRVGGALQMQDLLDTPPQSGNPPAVATVLVAPSNGLEEASELVDLAGRLFSEDEGVRVIVKCHPITPIEAVSRYCGVRLPRHVTVSEDSITDLMRESSVMVYSGSSVCTQALALSLPIIHLRPRFDLALDPLEATPDVRLEATGLKELRHQISWLLEHREEYIAKHRDRWKQVVDDMYGPVTQDTFRAFVE